MVNATHAPITVWLTGLPSSGKTTIARHVAKRFDKFWVIDSDEARNMITPAATYSSEERKLVYRCLVYCAYCLNKCGTNVIIAATANSREYRDFARRSLPVFYEVYVKCSVAGCMRRDSKGLYEKARKRLITTLPIRIEGQDNRFVSELFAETDIYQPPANPDLTIDTEKTNIAQASDILERFILDKTRRLQTNLDKEG